MNFFLNKALNFTPHIQGDDIWITPIIPHRFWQRSNYLSYSKQSNRRADYRRFVILETNNKNIDSTFNNYAFFEQYNECDIAHIQRQLGREKINIGGIIERCEYGFPAIMLLSPEVEINGKMETNYEAISNLMWLTCPYLNDKIHKLESTGLIKTISNLIQSENKMTLSMNKAHANFYFLRGVIFKNLVGTSFWQKQIGLFNTGIGGIRDKKTLKCLHMHFCHFRLCKDNIAGLLTYRLLNEKVKCDEGLCRNAN